jgi:hypothetical protein
MTTAGLTLAFVVTLEDDAPTMQALVADAREAVARTLLGHSGVRSVEALSVMDEAPSDHAPE